MGGFPLDAEHLEDAFLFVVGLAGGLLGIDDFFTCTRSSSERPRRASKVSFSKASAYLVRQLRVMLKR
jgi:hypothetical protein